MVCLVATFVTKQLVALVRMHVDQVGRLAEKVELRCDLMECNGSAIWNRWKSPFPPLFVCLHLTRFDLTLARPLAP